jgi:uncharacterized protein YhjY with autotransporter beta-barrel domain
MRKTAAIAAVGYLSLCHFAQAQSTVVGDVRNLISSSKMSIGDMGEEISFYNSVIAYRGPQLVNTWAVGAMDWPLELRGAPPSAVSAGVDFVDVQGWTIGFAASNTYRHAALSNNGDASITGVGGTVYANYSRGVGIGEFTINLQSTIDSLYIDLHRNELSKGVLFGNQASVNGLAWLPSAQVSYQLTERWFSHGPIVGIQAVATKVDGFSETGSITSQSFTNQTEVSATPYLGYSGKLDILNLQPFASIKANYLLSDTGNTVQTGFTSGFGPITSFSSIGPSELWSFNTQVGTRIFLTPAVTAFAVWSADHNSHFGPTENQGLVGASYAF